MTQSTRAKVIEKSVELEELISLLLSNLLDIDKEKSISFGSTGSALNFISKVNLLHDLNFLPEELKKNMLLFAEIRNKFAHLSYVDNFTKCFEIIYKNSNNNSRKNQLLEKGAKIKDEQIDEEVKLGACFDLLCLETSLLIYLSSQTIHTKKSEDIKKIGIVEIVRKITDTEDGFSNELIDWLKIQLKQIKTNQEFNLAYSEELNKIKSNKS